MRYDSLAVLLVVVLLTAVGCSNSDRASETSASSSKSTAATDQPLDAATTRAIGASTDAFMRAILQGDSSGASRLLTAKAARRYAADPSVLTPMGLQAVRLDIGEIRLLSSSEAAAQCLVTEVDATAPNEVCCLLKLEAAGWRICGMASDGGGPTPVVISFEEDLEPATQPTQFVEKAAEAVATPRTAAAPDTGEIR